MTRGVTKEALVQAVLNGLEVVGPSASEGTAEMSVARTLVQQAQPCKVEMNLEAVAPTASGKKSRETKVGCEVRVLGLRGSPRAVVSMIRDAKPASLQAGFSAMLAGARRRSECPAYQMLALNVDVSSENSERIDAELNALRMKAQEQLSSRPFEVFTGQVRTETGRTRVPVAVVMSLNHPSA